MPGSGTNPDINATAAYTSSLNVDSITVELFARTEESTAVMVSRSTTADVLNGIDDGFRLYDPQDLSVDYYTVDSNGVWTLNQIITNVGMDTGARGDGLADWRHIAFVYDAVTGTGTLYLDSVEIGSADTSDGSTLYWGDTDGGDQPIVQAGVDMDGFDFSKGDGNDGYLDELRITSTVRDTGEFHNTPVPEVSSYALLLGAMALSFRVARRKR